MNKIAHDERRGNPRIMYPKAFEAGPHPYTACRMHGGRFEDVNKWQVGGAWHDTAPWVWAVYDTMAFYSDPKRRFGRWDGLAARARIAEAKHHPMCRAYDGREDIELLTLPDLCRGGSWYCWEGANGEWFAMPCDGSEP